MTPSSLSEKRQNYESHNNHIPRLRSIASYGAFKPRALAIGYNTRATYATSHSQNATSTTTTTSAAVTTAAGGVPSVPTTHGPGSTPPSQGISGSGLGGGGDYGSIAAIGGPLGVTLFHTSKPHHPLLVFHHVSPSSTRPISSLKFQPAFSAPSSMMSSNHVVEPYHGNPNSLLACARGNGVLVWDTTGHSLSPLLGRLTCEDHPNMNFHSNYSVPGNAYINPTANPTNETSSYIAHADVISSMAWKGQISQSSSSFHHLLTTSPKSISQWDLRCWTPRMRPSLRFPFPSFSHYNNTSIPSHHHGTFALSNNAAGVNMDANTIASAKFVHVACHTDASLSNIHLVAVMDSIGVVRIYDDRKCQSPQSEFWAHERMGVGIESMILEQDRTDIHHLDDDDVVTNNDEGGSYHQPVNPSSSSNSYSSTTRRKKKLLSGWVTWGSDINHRDHIRVWKEKQDAKSTSSPSYSPVADPDSYWDMSDDYKTRNNNNNNNNHTVNNPLITYEMVTTFESPLNISCTRICPNPFVNGVVIVGPGGQKKEDNMAGYTATAPTNPDDSTGSTNVETPNFLWQHSMNWEAKVYSMDPCCSSKPVSTSSLSLSLMNQQPSSTEPSEQSTQPPQQGNSDSTANVSKQAKISSKSPKCLITFRGGETDVNTLSQVIGRKCDLGHLIAAELALGASPVEDDRMELRLCCLTSAGYLLTYVSEVTLKYF